MLCIVEADVFVINCYCGVRCHEQQMHNLENMRRKLYDHHTRHMHNAQEPAFRNFFSMFFRF